MAEISRIFGVFAISAPLMGRVAASVIETTGGRTQAKEGHVSATSAQDAFAGKEGDDSVPYVDTSAHVASRD